MANIGVTIPSRRKLLINTKNSNLLYRVGWFAENKLQTEDFFGYTTNLCLTNNKRTVSCAAALDLAWVIPVELLAKKRKSLYDLRQAGKASR